LGDEVVVSSLGAMLIAAIVGIGIFTQSVARPLRCMSAASTTWKDITKSAALELAGAGVRVNIVGR
jgi:hypothetical protein